MKKSEDTWTGKARRIRSHSVDDFGGAAANRLITGINTVGVGGSIAFFVGRWLEVPEEGHAHLTALVIFMWQTVMFIVSFVWRRYFGGQT